MRSRRGLLNEDFPQLIFQTILLQGPYYSHILGEALLFFFKKNNLNAELFSITLNFWLKVQKPYKSLKIFKILKSVLPVFMLHPTDDLISSCAALSNLKNRLIN